MGNKKNDLRVLMYHKTIESGSTDLLTVTRRQLEEQFQFFQREGYNCVSVREIINHIQTGSPLKEKPLLLTFDDGYKNNLTVLYPLLQKYNLKAVIFLVPGYIEKAEQTGQEYMNISEIQSMDPGIVEFGLHTFSHNGYNSLTLDQIEEDIIKTKDWLDKKQINYLPAHAYTYGQFPKNDKEKLNGLFGLFEKHGVKAAFNIGNRVNTLPLKKKFVIERIDVRGTESLSQFIPKVRKGRELVGFIKDILGKP
jgi:hypothetical protein